MTNNGTGKIENFNNVVYDHGNNTANGRNRVGVSATEVEFLNDIPPPSQSAITNSRNSASNQTRKYDTQTSSSSIDKQKQQSGYQTLSLNREQPKSNVVYQDKYDQQLGSAVDKLLDKYAPDANPQNLLNTSNSRRPPAQVNVVTARDEPSFSTFQTTAPPPAVTTHNYSTIIRPNTGQPSQTQTQINPNNNNNQPQTGTRPASSYDSFQHVIPPPQQQQQPQPSVSVKTKNGNVAQVVPGKLYPLNDDPLHILYDKQNIVPPTPQKPTFTTTFQPSSNFQTGPDPFSIFYTNTSERRPQQTIPTTTTGTNSNFSQPFDLGNLIKRVQQDYLREIEPFVSSVKFVEKDREFGQGIGDVGFTTPVTVEQGFTRQADDILRRSFGRPDGQQQPVNRYGNISSSDDDDIDELRPSNRHPPLEKFDSKQSFTSVTSVSTNGSDYNVNRSAGNNRKKNVEVHNQSTSPPPQLNQTNRQPQMQNPSATSVGVTQKPITKSENDYGKGTTVGGPSVPPKLAKRISSDQRSESSESMVSNDQEDYPITYNEHEHPGISRSIPPGTLPAIVANAPIIKTVDEATRERISTGNQVLQRSEDFHPTPPTIRAPQPNAQVVTSVSPSEKSDSVASESVNASDSEYEGQSTAYNEQPQASTTTRSNVPQSTSSIPAGRDTNPPQPNARVPAGRDTNPPQPNARVPVGRDMNPPTTNASIPVGRDANPPQANARVPAGRDANPPETNARVTTTTQNPPSNARTTTESNARQAVASGADPNNQRNPQATSTNQPVSTGTVAQTGSTRFFQSDNTPKSGGKRTTKASGPSVGAKIKSFFTSKNKS